MIIEELKLFSGQCEDKFALCSIFRNIHLDICVLKCFKEWGRFDEKRLQTSSKLRASQLATVRF